MKEKRIQTRRTISITARGMVRLKRICEALNVSRSSFVEAHIEDMLHKLRLPDISEYEARRLVIEKSRDEKLVSREEFLEQAKQIFSF